MAYDNCVKTILSTRKKTQLSFRRNGFLLHVRDWVGAVENRANRGEREQELSWELSHDYEGQEGPWDTDYKLKNHECHWCELIDSEGLRR